jgi:hypothetical protein
MVLHRHGLLDGVRISDKGRFVVLTAIREHAPGTPA